MPLRPSHVVAKHTLKGFVEWPTTICIAFGIPNHNVMFLRWMTKTSSSSQNFKYRTTSTTNGNDKSYNLSPLDLRLAWKNTETILLKWERTKREWAELDQMEWGTLASQVHNLYHRDTYMAKKNIINVFITFFYLNLSTELRDILGGLVDYSLPPPDVRHLNGSSQKVFESLSGEYMGVHTFLTLHRSASRRRDGSN